MSAELEIPAAALRALFDWDDDGEAKATVRSIASPVVAAELRAQATFLVNVVTNRGTARSMQNVNRAYELMARILRDRADELDGVA